MLRYRAWIFSFFAVPLLLTSLSYAQQPQCAYVANYLSNNISAYKVDPATGTLGAVAGSPFNDVFIPVSVAADPSGRFLYVANNVGFVDVSAFAINPSTCALTKVPGSPFSWDSLIFPIAVAVDPSGNFVYIASQTGVVACFAIDRTTGALRRSACPLAPAGLLPNSIALYPTGSFAYVTNLGGNVSGYTVDSINGCLTPAAGSPFEDACHFPGTCSPSAIALDPLGKFA